MKFARCCCMLAAIAATTAGAGSAATLMLRDGNRIVCQPISETSATITVWVGSMPVSFNREEVAGWEGGQSGATGQPALQPPTGQSPGPPASLPVRQGRMPAQCQRCQVINQVVLNVQGQTLALHLTGVKSGTDTADYRSQLSQLITARSVTVVFDETRRDSSGTLTGYLFTDAQDLSVNETILANGWGALELPAWPTQYAQRLEQAQQEAQRNRRGIWYRPPGVPTPAIASSLGGNPSLLDRASVDESGIVNVQPTPAPLIMQPVDQPPPDEQPLSGPRLNYSLFPGDWGYVYPAPRRSAAERGYYLDRLPGDRR
jgi:hypothetical protein